MMAADAHVLTEEEDAQNCAHALGDLSNPSCMEAVRECNGGRTDVRAYLPSAVGGLCCEA